MDLHFGKENDGSGAYIWICKQTKVLAGSLGDLKTEKERKRERIVNENLSDPSNKEQSELGISSSFLYEWSKASTISAVWNSADKKQNLSGEFQQQGWWLLQADFEQGTSTRRLGQDRNMSRFISKCVQNTQSQLPN